MRRNKRTKLFNYYRPHYAARTLRALQARWPENTFQVEHSPTAVYAFRYVIMAHLPDGRSAPVAKAPLASFVRGAS